ncbi:IQ motif and SEC7 domain-containing protein 2 [Hondaea fermentalgiana]|uniref:IQ motif and SEC7 domain-containing protein 2 n=1 Tax=Hondaea fermentalgiana TaxID=2315210 RepID=A0A2R5GT31_9STRA|nr:IQ motif and SEC7 domain-containing protein 2 [Hondaea fermentalgiana]|eukprot:GBG34026.1 IQ motif and SEC7 domain-containing protein 2 [Hondaea fermentalgiana]
MGNTTTSGKAPPEPEGPAWVFDTLTEDDVQKEAHGSGDASRGVVSQDVAAISDAYPFDVGSYRRDDIITRRPETAEWFHRGMNWMFGFHHEHAIACFRKSLQLEPDFCMAWWAIALCHGPNYNVHQNNGYFTLSKQKDGFPSQKRAFEAITKAVEYQRNANPVGRALISALRLRCTWPATDFARLLLEPYAQAMRLVFHDYRDDADVACVFADSLMQLSPWQLYDRREGTEAPQTAEINETLLVSLERFPQHPGLLHLFLHLKEMSPEPGDALPMARFFRDPDQVRDLGHLKHMPSHIDMLVGQYADAVQASAQALQANMKYIEYAHRVGEEFSLYIGYIAHDFHMYVYAAMMAGMEEAARGQGMALMRFIEDSVAVHRTRAVDLDLYHAVIYHVLIRFGCWDEILAQHFHTDVEAYCATNATLRYARGLAFAAKGQIAQARKEQDIFEKLRAVESVRVRIMHNNKCEHLFAVSSAMLDGEILYRESKFEAAFERLRLAVELEENLAYDEPWGQMQPIRHALGALLLEQGHVSEAEAVFRADLKRYPANPWSLTGLHDCLSRKDPVPADELRAVADELSHALVDADVDISSSCACAGLPCCKNSSDADEESGPTATEGGGPDVRAFRLGKELFARKPQEAVHLWAEAGVFGAASPCDAAVAKFLFTHEELDRRALWEFLASSKPVLEAYVRLFDVRDRPLDEALREVFGALGVFASPSDALHNWGSRAPSSPFDTHSGDTHNFPSPTTGESYADSPRSHFGPGDDMDGEAWRANESDALEHKRFACQTFADWYWSLNEDIVAAWLPSAKVVFALVIQLVSLSENRAAYLAPRTRYAASAGIASGGGSSIGSGGGGGASQARSPTRSAAVDAAASDFVETCQNVMMSLDAPNLRETMLVAMFRRVYAEPFATPLRYILAAESDALRWLDAFRGGLHSPEGAKSAEFAANVERYCNEDEGHAARVSASASAHAKIMHDLEWANRRGEVTQGVLWIRKPAFRDDEVASGKQKETLDDLYSIRFKERYCSLLGKQMVVSKDSTSLDHHGVIDLSKLRMLVPTNHKWAKEQGLFPFELVNSELQVLCACAAPTLKDYVLWNNALTPLLPSKGKAAQPLQQQKNQQTQEELEIDETGAVSGNESGLSSDDDEACPSVEEKLRALQETDGEEEEEEEEEEEKDEETKIGRVVSVGPEEGAAGASETANVETRDEPPSLASVPQTLEELTNAYASLIGKATALLNRDIDADLPQDNGVEHMTSPSTSSPSSPMMVPTPAPPTAPMPTPPAYDANGVIVDSLPKPDKKRRRENTPRAGAASASPFVGPGPVEEIPPTPTDVRLATHAGDATYAQYGFRTPSAQPGPPPPSMPPPTPPFARHR